jgi:hypothetical protein
MQQTASAPKVTRQPRLTIHVSNRTLSLAVSAPESGQQIIFEPYTVKSGISMAANLREAFKNSELLSRPYDRAMVMVDTPSLLIPVEEFEEKNIVTLYQHAFTTQESEVVLYNILPTLNAVAVFAMNKDLKMVIDDHFHETKFIVASSPVWSHLHQRSFTGSRRKLYGYFRNRQLDIFSFDKNRFKFCNTYQTDHFMDAVYFLLFVWQQLAMDNRKDELHLVGDIPEKEELLEELHKFTENVYVINPAADFNRAPITQISNLPYDLMTFFIKGR